MKTSRLTPKMLETLNNCAAQYVIGQVIPGVYSSDLTGGFDGCSYSTLRALARRGLVTRIADTCGCVETYYLTDDGVVAAERAILLNVKEHMIRAERYAASPAPGISSAGREMLEACKRVIVDLAKAKEALADRAA